MKKWALARLREPSTWRGLVWLATALGLVLKPEQMEAIVTLGVALAGLLGTFTSDAKAVPDDLPDVELIGMSESRNDVLPTRHDADLQGRPDVGNQ